MAAEARAAASGRDPVPVAQGRPGEGYPWFWEIQTWVEGETVPVEKIDRLRAARDLAARARALQAVDPAGAPPGRGIPLSERDESFRRRLPLYGRDPEVEAVWERALAAPPWDGPPVWQHGDLDARNSLVRDGRIAAVIDWGETGVGDSTCDVMVAWKLGRADARGAARQRDRTRGGSSSAPRMTP
ncbi:MAG TPA: phosphotransferase [Gaiellaceae bacterium]|nr:phosphotransferase [Gaiellaceae bacterium]